MMLRRGVPIPMSPELLADTAPLDVYAPKGNTFLGWVAEELSEALLWSMAGMQRPPSRTFDAFAHYKPRLFLPRRRRR